MLFDRMFVDIYHNDNHNDVHYSHAYENVLYWEIIDRSNRWVSDRTSCMVWICRLRLFNRLVVYEHWVQDKQRRIFVFVEEDFFERDALVLEETDEDLSSGMMVGGGKNNGDWTHWSRKFRSNASWYKRNGESDWKNIADDGGGG